MLHNKKTEGFETLIDTIVNYSGNQNTLDNAQGPDSGSLPKLKYTQGIVCQEKSIINDKRLPQRIDI